MSGSWTIGFMWKKEISPDMTNVCLCLILTLFPHLFHFLIVHNSDGRVVSKALVTNEESDSCRRSLQVASWSSDDPCSPVVPFWSLLQFSTTAFLLVFLSQWERVCVKSFKSSTNNAKSAVSSYLAAAAAAAFESTERVRPGRIREKKTNPTFYVFKKKSLKVVPNILSLPLATHTAEQNTVHLTRRFKS